MKPMNKKTVLIVDDEEDVVTFLSATLEDAGFTVVTASGGVEALQIMEHVRPDVISLDVVMPKGSGIKLYRELAKNPLWSNIPVIIVTGHARDDFGRADFNEMTLSGPGVYLEKPVTAAVYVKAIKSALGYATDMVSDEVLQLREEVKSLISNAPPETLREILKSIKKE